MKITICGSITFLTQMTELKTQLESKGFQVDAPIGEAIADGKVLDDVVYAEQKSVAIKRHFDKIAWADCILVANYEKRGIASYVGPNTLMEMGLAFYLRKPIYLLLDIPEVQFKDEILGMKPITLKGDVSLTS